MKKLYWLLIFYMAPAQPQIGANHYHHPECRCHERMIIHGHLLKSFFKTIMPMEYNAEYVACKLLNKNPLPVAVNYLAIPWAALISSNELWRVPKIKLNGGFTVCQCDNYEEIIPLLKEIGIDTLFSSCAIKDKQYEGITVLPFPYCAVNGPLPAKPKCIWYSFIGMSATHPIREKLFKIPKAKNAFLKNRKHWHFCLNEKAKKRYQAEYKYVLAFSRFSLCPRGVGAGSIRFWESLKAGAIPVIIGDDITLPTGVNWEECIVRVAEKDVLKINEILEAISFEQEQTMRKRCLEVYPLFSGENFVSVIRNHYLNNSPQSFDKIKNKKTFT